MSDKKRIQVSSYDPKTEMIELKMSVEDFSLINGVMTWVSGADESYFPPHFWETIIGREWESADQLTDALLDAYQITKS